MLPDVNKPHFWHAIKRERIHARVVLDMGDAITDPIYNLTFDFTTACDDVSEQVKDGTWARIGVENSA